MGSGPALRALRPLLPRGRPGGLRPLEAARAWAGRGGHGGALHGAGGQRALGADAGAVERAGEDEEQ